MQEWTESVEDGDEIRFLISVVYRWVTGKYERWIWEQGRKNSSSSRPIVIPNLMS